ncbi:MAG: large subunit ribosomal protein L32e [archaeon GW2011_AR16]|nr:MAG: large subunit ribosomal protein L32e [archaeon GW2011_AR16]
MMPKMIPQTQHHNAPREHAQHVQHARNPALASLLEIRKHKNKRKPNFTRQDVPKKARLDAVWRKPKGLQSKMRKHLRGRKRSPSPGFGSPRMVRGLSPQGYRPVVVFTPEMLSKINPQTEGVLIAGSVGQKKRAVIVKKTLELKLPLLNIKDAQGFLKSVESELVDRKKTKKEKKQVKEKKKEELEKKIEKEKAKEQKEKKEGKEDKGKEKGKEEKSEPTEEERKEQERREQEQLLIHGQ